MVENVYGRSNASYFRSRSIQEVNMVTALKSQTVLCDGSSSSLPQLSFEIANYDLLPEEMKEICFLTALSTLNLPL